MAKQSRSQKKTVERVMHEYKHGELESGRSKKKVRSRRQAIAIALSEAGASKFESRSCSAWRRSLSLRAAPSLPRRSSCTAVRTSRRR